MSELRWFEAIELLEPYVVRIMTPEGSGTRFRVSHSATDPTCAIATAVHVADRLGACLFFS